MGKNGMTSWLDCLECHDFENMAERVRLRVVAQQDVEVSWYERCLSSSKIKELRKWEKLVKKG